VNAQISPQQMVAKVSKLASFPKVALRVDEMMADHASEAKDIGAVIELDPALSAAILRVANSASYNISGSVDSVARAVALVGQVEIRNLTFAICATKTFKDVPNDLISMEDFWKHGLYCAAVAKTLGEQVKLPDADVLFTAGLLHDIGQLVMFNQCPDASRLTLQQSLDENDGLMPHLCEREIFGYDHTQVGAELAAQWNFPSKLQKCIRQHHMLCDETLTLDTSVVVNVANSLAVLAELNSNDLDEAPPIDERAFKLLGLSEDDIPELIDAARASVEPLIKVFVA